MSRISDALGKMILRARITAPGGRLREAESPSANKEEKGSVTGPLVAYQNLGEPVWTPRDYAAFAREGFMQNAIVYRSVRMIAEAAASMPLLLYDGADEIDEHPLLDLHRAARARSHAARFAGSLVRLPARRRQRLPRGGRRRRRRARAARAAPRPHEGDPRAPTAGRKPTSTPPPAAAVRFADERCRGVRPILHVRALPSRQRPLRHEPHRGGGHRDRHPQHRVALEQGAARQLRAALRRARLRRRETAS